MVIPPKVTCVIFVEVAPVMTRATSIISASQGLPVLATEAVAMARVAPDHVALKFLGLSQSGWCVSGQDKSYSIIIASINGPRFYYSEDLVCFCYFCKFEVTRHLEIFFQNQG